MRRTDGGNGLAIRRICGAILSKDIALPTSYCSRHKTFCAKLNSSKEKISTVGETIHRIHSHNAYTEWCCKVNSMADNTNLSKFNYTLRHSITEVKQRWLVIGWLTKNLLSRAPPCFGRHVKLVVPVAFAVVSTL
jgi:hypothetical protein